jgi:hypothetical protein
MVFVRFSTSKPQLLDEAQIGSVHNPLNGSKTKISCGIWPKWATNNTGSYFQSQLADPSATFCYYESRTFSEPHLGHRGMVLTYSLHIKIRHIQGTCLLYVNAVDAIESINYRLSAICEDRIAE